MKFSDRLPKNDLRKKILVDADLILELFINRSGYVEEAEHLLEIIQAQQVQLYLTEYCLSKIDSFLGKTDENLGSDAVKKIKAGLGAYIVPVNDKHIEQARKLPLKDFESCIELACATEIKADAIVTQDLDAFTGSNLPIWSVTKLKMVIWSRNGLVTTPSEPQRIITKKRRLAIASLAATFTLAISLSATSGAILTATRIQRQWKVEFEQAQAKYLNLMEGLRSIQDYENCIAISNNIPANSSSYVQAQAIKTDCENTLVETMLKDVRNLISEGNFKSAMDLATHIPSSSYDNEVEQLIDNLSLQLLNIAQEYYQQPTSNYLNNASYLIDEIPTASSFYSAATARRKQWQDEYFDNQKHLKSAQKALEQGKLGIAVDEISQISNHPFWQKEVESISSQIKHMLP